MAHKQKKAGMSTIVDIPVSFHSIIVSTDTPNKSIIIIHV